MNTTAWSDVDRFLCDLLVEEDDALRAALASSAAAGLPPIAVAPNQGKLLELLARAIGARAILEVGTLGGYSTIWLARALPPGGRLDTLELDPRHAEIARRNLARAGLVAAVDVHVGPALATLDRLIAEHAGSFDLAFIDADKEHTLEYFERALALSRPGGLIVVDNVVREGAVTNPATADASVRGIRRFLEHVGREPRVRATALQTVGSKGWDGLALVWVAAE